MGNVDGIRDDAKQYELFHHPEYNISLALSKEEFASILRSIKRDKTPQTAVLKEEAA